MTCAKTRLLLLLTLSMINAKSTSPPVGIIRLNPNEVGDGKAVRMVFAFTVDPSQAYFDINFATDNLAPDGRIPMDLAYSAGQQAFAVNAYQSDGSASGGTLKKPSYIPPKDTFFVIQIDMQASGFNYWMGNTVNNLTYLGSWPYQTPIADTTHMMINGDVQVYYIGTMVRYYGDFGAVICK